MNPLLYTVGLTRRFGGITAVNEVDFYVHPGVITGLIGPNGAGKTTLFNNLTGLDVPSSGQVYFNERDITGKSAWKIARMGIARTFQNIRLFKDLTVLENAMIGRHFAARHKGMPRTIEALVHIFKRKQQQKLAIEEAMESLAFMGLADLAGETARNLPYGRQRELEIARALATRPHLLFLDEPAAGMNPSETKVLTEVIEKIAASGVDVVLIEHDMKLVMSICQRITVLSYGSKIAEGSPADIRANPQVIEAYLGKEE